MENQPIFDDRDRSIPSLSAPHLDVLKEEFANAVTHALGILFSIVAITWLVSQAVFKGSELHILSCALFGGSMLLVYTASTLYHSIQHISIKPLLRKIDHMSIYVLIAGSYTPFLLISIKGVLGWVCFGIVWTIAIIGILYKAFFSERFAKLSLPLYLGMGWMIVIIVKPFIATVPAASIFLVALGGLSYTVGTFFYVQKSLRYAHAIWHVFVLGGTISHFAAVLYII